MRQLRPGGNGWDQAALRPFLLWTGLILLLVVPWFTWQTHPHWERVQWTPSMQQLKAWDVIANVLLYLPFGYWARRLWPSKGIWQVLMLAALLSLGTELSQVYSHGRFPTARDVVCNVLGACLGTGLRGWGQRSAKDDGIPLEGPQAP